MKFENRTIGAILHNKIDVPKYQREYSWDKDNVSDFFNDITDFIKTRNMKDDQYLIGQIIMHTEVIDGETVYHIVDGQQRLTTSVIFLKALRKHIVELRDKTDDPLEKESLEDIRSPLDRLIGKPKQEHTYHFSISGDGELFFKTFILDEDHNKKPTRPPAVRRIVIAFDQLYDLIASELESADDKVKLLDNYYDAIVNRIFASYVETDDLGQAYIVFETLNARGCELSYKDLIKNYFYAHIKDSNSVNIRWNGINTKLSNLNKKDRDYLSLFIRYYWNSKHEMARSRVLYKAISDYFGKDSLKIDNFLTELYDNVDLFVDIMSCNSNERITEKCSDSIRRMIDVDAISFIPLIMAMCFNYSISAKEIESVVNILEILIFRNRVIMKITANHDEVQFAGLAVDAYTGIKTVTEIKTELNNTIISDENIIPFLETFEPSVDQAKNLLKYLYDSNNSVLSITKSDQSIQLEHIMPKDISKWDVSPEIYKQYLNRLGNLTLLIGKDNALLKNAPFEDKRVVYKLSDYPDNVRIADNINWGANEIIARQSYLTKRIIERWPVN